MGNGRTDTVVTKPVERSAMNDDESREVDPELVDRLLEEAGDRELLGEGGLLSQLTKQVLEAALDAEMTAHLGYERGDPAGRGSGNSRNGSCSASEFVSQMLGEIPHRWEGPRTHRRWRSWHKSRERRRAAGGGI